MSAIPYCDHHGWRWDGSGPSPCMGETISFWLAVFGCLCSGLTSSSYFTVQRRASLAGSFGAKVHGVQIALSLAQSIVALIGGVLSARPSGMLCGALLLHTLGWTVAWLASAFAISRNADLCKRLVWWWLGGAITNRYVSRGCKRLARVGKWSYLIIGSGVTVRRSGSPFFTSPFWHKLAPPYKSTYYTTSRGTRGGSISTAVQH